MKILTYDNVPIPQLPDRKSVHFEKSGLKKRSQKYLHLPAHNFVGEKDPTHLWVFVLAFVPDGLFRYRVYQSDVDVLFLPNS